MRHILRTGTILLLTSVVSQASAAEPPAGPIFTFSETAAGCKFHLPLDLAERIGPDQAVTWSGPCLSGRISGQGVLRSVRGDSEVFSYEGAALEGAPEHLGVFRRNGVVLTTIFHEGQPDRHIIVVFPSGRRYEGEATVDGKPDGRGIMALSDGTRYDGEWHLGVREGHGVSTWPSGALYDGDWHDDRPSGQGKLSYASGDRFEGAFRAGKRQGHGTFFYPTGDSVEGEWTANLPVGTIRYVSPTGLQYDGSIGADLRPAGQGAMLLANGDKYEGEWRAGLPDGTGTLKRADGTSFMGHWVSGCFSEGERNAAFRVAAASCRRQ